MSVSELRSSFWWRLTKSSWLHVPVGHAAGFCEESNGAGELAWPFKKAGRGHLIRRSSPVPSSVSSSRGRQSAFALHSAGGKAWCLCERPVTELHASNLNSTCSAAMQNKRNYFRVPITYGIPSLPRDSKNLDHIREYTHRRQTKLKYRCVAGNVIWNCGRK